MRYRTCVEEAFEFVCDLIDETKAVAVYIAVVGLFILMIGAIVVGLLLIGASMHGLPTFSFQHAAIGLGFIVVGLFCGGLSRVIGDRWL